MKRLNCILVAVALIVGGTAVAQVQIQGGPIKPPIPPAKQRQKPKKKARPKKQVKRLCGRRQHHLDAQEWFTPG